MTNEKPVLSVRVNADILKNFREKARIKSFPAAALITRFMEKYINNPERTAEFLYIETREREEK